MDTEQAKRRLSQISDEAHVIYDRAKNVGRDLEISEAEQLDRLLDEADALRRKIRTNELADHLDEPLPPRIPPPQPGAMMPSGDTEYYQETRQPQAASSPWRTRDGRAVPVFGKGQSMAAHYPASDGQTFGGLLRAMVTGAGTGKYKNTLMEGQDSLGGLTVPEALLAEVIDALRAQSVLFQAGAQVMALPEGNPVSVVKLTGDPTCSWHLESVEISPSTPTFGSVQFLPKTLTSLVKMSRELAEDALNAEPALMQAFSGAMAQEIDRAGLLGSGAAGEPTGIANVTGIGSVSMGANGLALSDYSPIVNAIYELEVDNSPAPTAILMHPRTKKELAVLEDSTGQPLMAPPALDGIPTLTTTAIRIDDVQGSATDASKIYVGHFPNLIWGSVHDLRIELLREKYASSYELGFLVHMRGDWAVTHAESFSSVVGIIPA